MAYKVPASLSGIGTSTDNALVRWDGTGGATLQNGVITEDDTGNLSISASVSGGSISCLVANTSNTATSTAFHNSQVAGGTASDAYYKAEISGGQAWTFGLDNSDSDAYVLSASATPGTTNVMHVATTGEVNLPLQPSFLAILGSQDDNQTGDATSYTLGAVTSLTEIFDQNSDFNTNGTFTAPVSGNYQLTSQFYTRGYLVAHTKVEMRINTSNRNYIRIWQGFNAADNSADNRSNSSYLCDMDAADTSTSSIIVSNGTKVIDIGGTSTASSFSGFLAN